MAPEIEAEGDDEPAEEQSDDATALPRAFIVEASGPATIVRDRGGVTKRTEGEISVTRRIETLAEFGEFWALHTKRYPKLEAIDKLLGELEDDSGPTMRTPVSGTS